MRQPHPLRRAVISIHALREEGDFNAPLTLFDVVRFLSTPSARRATRAPGLSRPGSKYFYPRPPRGGRRPSMVMVPEPSVFLSTPSARRATTVLPPLSGV